MALVLVATGALTAGADQSTLACHSDGWCIDDNILRLNFGKPSISMFHGNGVVVIYFTCFADSERKSVFFFLEMMRLDTSKSVPGGVTAVLHKNGKDVTVHMHTMERANDSNIAGLGSDFAKLTDQIEEGDKLSFTNSEGDEEQFDAKAFLERKNEVGARCETFLWGESQ